MDIYQIEVGGWLEVLEEPEPYRDSRFRTRKLHKPSGIALWTCPVRAHEMGGEGWEDVELHLRYPGGDEARLTIGDEVAVVGRCWVAPLRQRPAFSFTADEVLRLGALGAFGRALAVRRAFVPRGQPGVYGERDLTEEPPD